uniref:Nuclear pore membrane glycoprotein n=1 Tax=Steinernema glaseri TaxID=37863 RepID=A0A1I8AJS5_9BILA
MGWPAILALFLCLSLGPRPASAFRLNVPRVLLPYHPTNPVAFLLEVTDPKGGCFSWRSTRPEIVAVHTVDAHPSGCSSRAVVTAVSKHAEEHSAVIFAQDTQTGTSLSCGVTVDVIKSISITTTTRILHIDAAPAKMVVEAFNREGDRFSNLGDIPFEWNFSGKEVKPLRIVPFSQSKYEAPEGIQKLENAKKKGFVILVEGHSTGSAKLTAKLSESYFENVNGNSIDLVVVANLILVPSSDVFVIPHSTIRYGIQLIKSGRTEPITLPSPQYYLKLSNDEVCSLKNEETTVVAEKVGQTEISLIDKNIEGKLGIKPESAHIYVVEPDTIEFTIDRGNSWYLETNTIYTVTIRVLDELGNSILIPEQANFDTVFSPEHFEVLERSRNGTWIVVKATNAGKTTIQSTFVSLVGYDGKEHKINARVTGQRAAQISDPIQLSPNRLILPLSSKHGANYRFTATGGTGAYTWASTNTNTARVDEMNGLITPYSYGSTSIEVRDGRNSLHKAEAQVYVLEPAMIKFAASPVEAEVGRLLVLNVEIAGLLASGQYVSFSDCRGIELRYQVEDSSIFSVESNVENSPPEEGNGCTTVVLRSLSSGDTKLTVFVGDHAATIAVSAYLPLAFDQLHSKSSEFLLALGSDISVAHSGGPRPWLLDGSNYFSTMSTDSDLLEITQNQGTYQVFCGNRQGIATLKLTVGNKRTSTNPFPAVAVAEQIVCCSKPSRISLSFHKDRISSASARSCPVTSHLVNSNTETQLELSLFGRCESEASKADDRRFDSVSSVAVSWTTNAAKLVSVQDVALAGEHQGKLFALAKPNGLRGQAIIKAELAGFKSLRSLSGSITPFEEKSKLHDSITLGFVSRPSADSSSVVLFNEATVTGNVKVRGGSGYFVVAPGYSHNILEPSLASGKESAVLEISPRGKGKANVTIHDLCIQADPLVVEVEVTDLYDIAIAAPNLFVHGNEFKTRLSLNSESEPGSAEAQLSDVHVHIDGCKDSTLDVQPIFETSEVEGKSKPSMHYEISVSHCPQPLPPTKPRKKSKRKTVKGPKG